MSTSVYKNILGTVGKVPFQELQLNSQPIETSGMSCGETTLAYIQKSVGGIVSVISLADLGRRPPVLRLTGHKGPIADINHNPFKATLLASASEDMTLKLWEVPSDKATWAGLNAAGPSPCHRATLTGHEKKLVACHWNSVVDGVLASAAADFSTRVWDVEKQSVVAKFDVAAVPTGICWNTQGNLLAVSGKDKKLRILDPKSPESVPGEINAHEGSRSIKVAWADGQRGNSYSIVTSGFTRTGGRELRLWDHRQFNDAVQVMPLDNGSGFVLLHWEESLGVLLVAPKAATYMRPYSFENGKFIHLSDFKDSTAQRGLGYLPLRRVDVGINEVMRVYKGDETGTTIWPISFAVHRRDMSQFQPELYPPCFSGEPALSVSEWLAGKPAELRRCEVSETGFKLPISQKDIQSTPAAPIAQTLKVAEQRKPDTLTTKPKPLNNSTNPTLKAKSMKQSGAATVTLLKAKENEGAKQTPADGHQKAEDAKEKLEGAKEELSDPNGGSEGRKEELSDLKEKLEGTKEPLREAKGNVESKELLQDEEPVVSKTVRFTVSSPSDSKAGSVKSPIKIQITKADASPFATSHVTLSTESTLQKQANESVSLSHLQAPSVTKKWLDVASRQRSANRPGEPSVRKVIQHSPDAKDPSEVSPPGSRLQVSKKGPEIGQPTELSRNFYTGENNQKPRSLQVSPVAAGEQTKSSSGSSGGSSLHDRISDVGGFSAALPRPLEGNQNTDDAFAALEALLCEAKQLVGGLSDCRRDAQTTLKSLREIQGSLLEETQRLADKSKR